MKRKETREEKEKGKEYLFTEKRIEGNLLPHVLAMYHQQERKRDDEKKGRETVMRKRVRK